MFLFSYFWIHIHIIYYVYKFVWLAPPNNGKNDFLAPPLILDITSPILYSHVPMTVFLYRISYYLNLDILGNMIHEYEG